MHVTAYACTAYCIQHAMGIYTEPWVDIDPCDPGRRQEYTQPCGRNAACHISASLFVASRYDAHLRSAAAVVHRTLQSGTQANDPGGGTLELLWRRSIELLARPRAIIGCRPPLWACDCRPSRVLALAPRTMAATRRFPTRAMAEPFGSSVG